jgi:hypothetical protein
MGREGTLNFPEPRIKAPHTHSPKLRVEGTALILGLLVFYKVYT